jgi:hypothetical protein
MTKKVPYLPDFTSVEDNERIKDYILYSSVVISIFTLIIESVKFENGKELTLAILNSLNCLFAVGYFAFDIIANSMFRKAEMKRRDDLFDNSLNTKIAEEKSVGYFSNDNHNHGITKLGINCFENSFFSKAIASTMLKPMMIKSALVLFVFIVLALCANNKIISTVFQFALPYTILLQTYRLYLYIKGMETSFKNFQIIFSAVASTEREKHILHNTVTHEATQAWACVKLHTPTFYQLNPSLTIQWEAIKMQYGIA